VHPLLLLLLLSGLDHAHDASAGLALPQKRCHHLVELLTALLRGSKPFFMRAAFPAVLSQSNARLRVESHSGEAAHVRPYYIM